MRTLGCRTTAVTSIQHINVASGTGCYHCIEPGGYGQIRVCFLYQTESGCIDTGVVQQQKSTRIFRASHETARLVSPVVPCPLPSLTVCNPHPLAAPSSARLDHDWVPDLLRYLHRLVAGLDYALPAARAKENMKTETLNMTNMTHQSRIIKRGALMRLPFVESAQGFGASTRKDQR